MQPLGSHEGGDVATWWSHNGASHNSCIYLGALSLDCLALFALVTEIDHRHEEDWHRTPPAHLASSHWRPTFSTVLLAAVRCMNIGDGVNRPLVCPPDCDPASGAGGKQGAFSRPPDSLPLPPFPLSSLNFASHTGSKMQLGVSHRHDSRHRLIGPKRTWLAHGRSQRRSFYC